MHVLSQRNQFPILLSLIKSRSEVQLHLLLKDDRMGRSSISEVAQLITLLDFVPNLHSRHAARHLCHPDENNGDLANFFILCSNDKYLSSRYCSQEGLAVVR